MLSSTSLRSRLIPRQAAASNTPCLSSKATSPVAKMVRREEREVEVQDGKETPEEGDVGAERQRAAKDGEKSVRRR